MFPKGCIILCTHVFHVWFLQVLRCWIWEHGESYKKESERKLDSLWASSQQKFNQQTTHSLWWPWLSHHCSPLLQSHLGQAICTSIPSESLWWCNHNCATETSHPPPSLFFFLVEYLCLLYLRLWWSSFFLYVCVVVLSVQNRTCVMAEKHDIYVKRSTF